MSIGNNQKPYRSACGNRTCPTGPAYRHAITRVIADKFTNVSTYTVTHKTCDPWQMTTPTALEYNQDECGLFSCSGYACDNCKEDGTPEYKLVENLRTLVLNEHTGATEAVNNNFVPDGTIDLTPCRALGFKAVQAKKAWHGRYGFTSAEADGHACGSSTTFADSKYRVVSRSFASSFSAGYTHTFTDATNACGLDGYLETGVSGISWSYSASTVFEVGQTTGVITQTSLSVDEDIANNGTYFTTMVNWQGATADWSWIPGVTPGDRYEITGVVDASGVVTLPTGPVTSEPCIEGPVPTDYPNLGIDFSTTLLAAFRNLRTIMANVDSICSKPSYYNGSETVTFDDLAAFVAFISEPFYGIAPHPEDVTVTILDENGDPGDWTLTDVLFAGGVSVAVAGTVVVSPGVEFDDYNYSASFQFNIALSGEYTSADVYAETQAVAAGYLFDDDALYPWRTDSYCYIAPLMRHNEVSTPVNPDLRQFTAYTDPLADVYDGTVVGPLPAGYQGVFDPMHDNWRHTFCAGTETPSAGKYSRGAVTPSFLPQNAPRWTDDGDLNGGWVWPCNYAAMDTSGCWLQKFAEVMIRRPSINFGRPYGPDRFTMDEENVYQFVSQSGSDVTLVTWDNQTPVSLPFVAGDIVGGPCVSGFYAVTSTSGNVITWGAKFADVPTGWQSAASFQAGTDDTALVFGKLRWPTAPGIGGLLAVSAATYNSGTGLTTLTTAAAPHILTGDKVDVAGFGLYSLSTNQTITRVDDTHFTLTGDYSTAKFLTAYGHKWYFANDTSKGDFVWRTWELSLPAMTVTAEDHGEDCLPFKTCEPQVLYGTPNTEDFPNSFKFDFPASVAVGTAWVAQFEQHMVDPFYQVPHKPCGVIDATAENADALFWNADDGTCIADTTETFGLSSTRYLKRYAFPPLVEARLTLATGYGAAADETAPAMAAGTAPLDPTVAPPSNAQFVAYGTVPDCVIAYSTPWGIYLNQHGCIDAAGRFANEYTANLAAL